MSYRPYISYLPILRRLPLSVVHFHFSVLRQYLTRLRSIADSHNLKVIEIDVFLRDVLNVISRYRRNSLGVSIPVVRWKIVEFLRDDVLQEELRLLERKREAANYRAFCVVQFFRGYFFFTQTL